MRYCMLIVNNEGIRLVVDDQHNQQASAYFKYEQFSDFTMHIAACNIRVPVNILMVRIFKIMLNFSNFKEALNMFTR